MRKYIKALIGCVCMALPSISYSLDINVQVHVDKLLNKNYEIGPVHINLNEYSTNGELQEALAALENDFGGYTSEVTNSTALFAQYSPSTGVSKLTWNRSTYIGSCYYTTQTPVYRYIDYDGDGYPDDYYIYYIYDTHTHSYSVEADYKIYRIVDGEIQEISNIVNGALGWAGWVYENVKGDDTVSYYDDLSDLPEGLVLDKYRVDVNLTHYTNPCSGWSDLYSETVFDGNGDGVPDFVPESWMNRKNLAWLPAVLGLLLL